MNHIGDTNKMVSETPRMDASAYDDGAIWETGCDIERELNAASKERDDALMMLGMYRMKSDEQTQRIKRLEDALTSIGEYWNRDNNERAMEDACWHAVNTAAEALEAKEAKL